jgi:tripartite-type tricarboxylate transporter receptor subunit TctC
MARPSGDGGYAPREIVVLLSREINRAVAQPDIVERLAGLGFESAQAAPDELAALVKSEIPKWAGVIRTADIKPE